MDSRSENRMESRIESRTENRSKSRTERRSRSRSRSRSAAMVLSEHCRNSCIRAGFFRTQPGTWSPSGKRLRMTLQIFIMLWKAKAGTSIVMRFLRRSMHIHPGSAREAEWQGIRDE